MSFFAPPSPYPADRYTGDGGEVSARLRRADAPHDLTGGAGTCDYLATGAGTGGDYGLYRWNMAPRQGGPDPHFHRTLSESFFVLDGTVALYDGERWIDASAGDFLYVPEGGRHGFRNDSDEAASMLILFAPGAPREAYFEGLDHVARTGERPARRNWRSSSTGTTPTGSELRRSRPPGPG